MPQSTEPILPATAGNAGQSSASLEILQGLVVSQRFLERIPISFARRFCMVGLDDENGGIVIAIRPDQPPWLADSLGGQLCCAIRAVEADAVWIQRSLNAAYAARTGGLTIDGEGDTSQEIPTSDLAALSTDLLDDDANAPVVQLVNRVLLEAIRRRASDVHVQPLEDGLVVRLRIDGVLYDYVRPTRGLLDEIVSRIKVLGRMDIAERRLPQDGRTTVTLGERSVDLRISSLPTNLGERVVIRLLDKSARLYRLDELGMSDHDRGAFKELICRPHGIILVTGPTGSGKSTTLYAALQELNHTELNILTIEDPIEYHLPGISQSQVSSRKGMTFATGLRTVLRQDPDVIMVGEIRDEETARMAVQAALTGHLVFSTLHTNDAAGAVARLTNLGVEPYLVASSLLAVIAQRLVRKLCNTCSRPYEMTDIDRARAGIPANVDTIAVRAAVGCPVCLETGYHERWGVFELLQVDETIRSLIVKRAEAGAIRRSAKAAGMATLRQDAISKLLTGSTSLEEVFRITMEADGEDQAARTGREHSAQTKAGA